MEFDDFYLYLAEAIASYLDNLMQPLIGLITLNLSKIIKADIMSTDFRFYRLQYHLIVGNNAVLFKLKSNILELQIFWQKQFNK